ncbi:GNAT family N-acetyltransferase [Phreatobacter aquaticus]|uniref:GNAT family N-acetyltransferase n=1 Tax=Phreatobacter aquaticus TaxID=2570229 RepID=A0A4D7QQE0_9HYPH|nr:GNAT family N-acetyltransferase [Phreatobacter aquaticus]QCK86342.1 GNAT family N-acetyltransferase [Phreatobacter aquaticus]
MSTDLTQRPHLAPLDPVDDRLDRMASPPLQPYGTADRDAGALTTRWVEAEDWAQLEAAWRALAACAEPNVFLCPAFALAARAIDQEPDLGAVVIERDGFLVGFAAGRFRRRGLVFSLWTHPYAPYGLPLMERGREADILDALFRHLADAGVAALDWPLADEGPASQALEGLISAGHRRVDLFDHHRRAVMTAAPPKPSKEMRRLSRRLGETGDLRHCTTARDLPMDIAANAFLKLEADGWKGRKGTALAGSGETLAFFHEVALGLAEAGDARIDLLTLDGRPIAAGVVLAAGNRAWYWKTAYDETLARYSPGILLTQALAADLAEDGRFALVDSCAIPGHSMIDRIWPERMAIASRYIAVPPGRPSVDYRIVAGTERLRLGARRAAKALLARLKGGRAKAGG